MNIFIDTQIWAYAFKRPSQQFFRNKEEYERAFSIHQKANEFLQKALTEDTIYITTHQLAEIFHVLAYRGSRVNTIRAYDILESIIKSMRTVIVEISRKHYREAMRLSSLSGIHVWDFLCVLPIRKNIDIAYTNDKHFLHPTLKNLLPRIENPVEIWIET